MVLLKCLVPIFSDAPYWYLLRINTPLYKKVNYTVTHRGGDEYTPQNMRTHLCTPQYTHTSMHTTVHAHIYAHHSIRVHLCTPQYTHTSMHITVYAYIYALICTITWPTSMGCMHLLVCGYGIFSQC